MIRSANPVLRDDTFTTFGSSRDRSELMTVNGTVAKTGICLLLCMLTAGFTWMKFFQSGGNVAAVQSWLWIGMIGGFITAMVTAFKPTLSAYTAPAYALLEGLFIGAISSIFELRYPGIVIQAAGLTFGTLGTMLAIYESGLIQVTERFKLGVFAATGAIALVYFVSFILSFFGMYPSFMYSSSLLSIGLSFVVVGIAALNLVIDFDFIEQGARRGAPKYMEWYGAFALMVTLIWLYVEFLRLLSKLRNK